ncbi:hypothetical protein [Nocardia yamanashiensis]|uniref:hypothetical protein n=1 Tax=Nocardia yamanashiensis TaxID=209247 RepID=UPI000AC4A67F|nr:hypothetical protein [Nocardia yamanashiensis]
MTRRAARLVPLLFTVGLAAAVGGCGHEKASLPASSTTPPPWTTPTAITAAGPAAGDSPEAVAAAAMRELYTLRPTSEAAGDALNRIRPWLSPALLARLGPAAAPVASHQSAPSQWASWKAGGARVDAATLVSAERPPSEAPGHASRKVGVTQTAIWPDGHSEALAPFTVIVDLIQASPGWRVDDYRSW